MPKFNHLNLGSGDNYINGFCNIDKNPFIKKDMEINILRIEKMFPPNSIEFINCEDVIQYLSEDDFNMLICSFSMLLKKGGFVQIKISENPKCGVLVEKFMNDNPNFGTIQQQITSKYLCDKMANFDFEVVKELKSDDFFSIQFCLSEKYQKPEVVEETPEVVEETPEVVEETPEVVEETPEVVEETPEEIKRPKRRRRW
jgi:predicted SAM-dependent methyltransferase